MRIDVVICTWNRCHLLGPTLERLREIDVPPHVDWQVIVVDNNCTDNTAALLQILPDVCHWHHLRVTCWSLNARNRAVAEVTGDYLVWTDDDVLVERRWLEAYADAFERWPAAAFFGGPVEPWFEGTPPRWLAEHWRCVSHAFAVRELGDAPFPFDGSQFPYGANCAFRLDVQRRYPYDPSLGRRPDASVSGEETQVMRQMLADGLTGWWVPDAEGSTLHSTASANVALSPADLWWTGRASCPCPANIECTAVVWPTTVALAKSTGSRNSVLVRSRNVRPRGLAARADRDREGVARSQEHTLITACGPRQQLRRSAAVHVSFSDGTDCPATRRHSPMDHLGAQSARKRKWRMMRFVTSHRGVCGGLIQ